MPSIDQLTRRASLTVASAGIATLVAACDGDDGERQDTTQTISPERKRGDAAVLASLLDLERTAVFAYGAARQHLGSLADRFLRHEQAHARALERALTTLGADPEPVRPRSAYANDFPPLRTREDALRFALDVEETQIAAYGDSVPSLFTPELRVTLATILGVQGEHMAVVLGELDEPQSPRDFLVGKPPE